MSEQQGDSTRLIDIGGGHIGFLYPKVYTDFMLELNRNHQDLIRLMQIAQVSFTDGTAIQYLNSILGTEVPQFAPMEIGFAELLDALRMRVNSDIVRANAERVAKEQQANLTSGIQRDSSEHGKPMFPTWDEEQERADREEGH